MPQENGKEPDIQALIAAFEQSWLHARHKESERLWFTNIYAVIVAWVLAYISSTNFDAVNYFYLSVFLLIFSVLGIFFSIKIDAGYRNHMNNIERLIKKLGIGDYMKLLYSSGIWNYIRVSYIFLCFYIIMSIIWLTILI
jgi:hypothetical protein